MSRRSRHHHRSPGSVRRRKSLPVLAGWIGGAVLLALIAAAILILRPQEGSQAETAGGPPEISVDEAYQAYQEGAFILDVRRQEEWNEFHIPGTTLIPLDQLENRLDELPRDRRIILVCRSGNRSRQGAAILQEAGFSDVACMTGGLPDWSDAGYPVEGTRP